MKMQRKLEIEKIKRKMKRKTRKKKKIVQK